MNIAFGPVSLDQKTRKLGARVFVSMPTENGWAGIYEFDSHGMSPADVDAKIAQLQGHHAKKAVRLTAFAAVRGVELVEAKRVFRVVDCTVWEIGGDDVEMYVDVREIVGADELPIVGFPIKARYSSIDDVPSNAGIVALAAAVVTERVATENAHASYITRVAALLPSIPIALPKGGLLP